MLSQGVAAFISGSLVIEVKLDHSERFINLCLSHDIPLWNIQIENDVLTAHTTIDGYRQMPVIARKCRCVPRIKRKIGMPFVLARLFRRRTLVISCIAAVVLLYAASSFIWFVDVVGTQTIDPHEIIEAAANYGLHRGALRSQIDLDYTRIKLEHEFPAASWIGIKVEGTRAIIKVVEKVTPPQQVEVTGDIIAAKDGYLIRLVAIQGTRRVSVPQTVAKGDILVEGRLYIQDQVLKEIKAEAIAEAKVWYQGYGTSCLRQQLQLRTGREYVQWVVRVKNREIVVKGRGTVPFECYQLEEEVSRPSWRNITLPVEVVKRTYYELEQKTRILSREQATAEAEAVAQAEVLSKVPQQAFVLDRRVDIIESKDADTVTVRVTIETKEDIGQFRAHR